MTGHDTGKSLTSFKDASTAGGLITCWKSTNFTDRTTVTSPTTSDVGTTPTRRPLEDCNSSPITVLAPSKRMRFMEEDIDERIERCKRGTYSQIIYLMHLMFVSTFIRSHNSLLCGCGFNLGIMELPVNNISKPPKGSRLLREPDNIFISELKKRMIKDPSAPGAAPMAVLCKDMQSLDTFEMKHKNVYRYIIWMFQLQCVCTVFFCM